MKKTSFTVHLLLEALQCFTVTALATYYCKPNKENLHISGVESGYIYTKLNNTNFYTNNMECQWTIDAGSDSKAVRLTILNSDLQDTPDYSICATYDFVKVLITDRYTGDMDEAVSFCGKRNPDAVISNSRYMKIVFESNDVSFYDRAGVKMFFTTFEWSSGCPPGWSEPSPSSDYCYIIKKKPMLPWEKAQYHCNYEGSNLATITDEEEYNFIHDIANNSISKAWISLNDIAKENSIWWLDKTRVTYELERYIERTSSDDGNDCFAQDFQSGKFVESHCLYDEFGFICKKHKGQYTEKLDVPVAGIIDEEDEDNDGILLIVGVISGVVGLLLLVGIIAACVVCSRRGQRFQSTDRNSDDDFNTDRSTSSRFAQDRNVSPPAYHEAVSMKTVNV